VSRGTPVHRFRINGHEPIGLDLPAIIGRKPSAPRISSGRLARLVRVPSPLREVSSTHLELRQHGASVIVTDLKSTNGTIVAIPGFSAQKLRQGESVVVSAGTVVDIGDGNLVEILPVERIAPAGG
jgi:pSer/pThr/pTyr-binding forkhead associated (FHA) protein